MDEDSDNSDIPLPKKIVVKGPPKVNACGCPQLSNGLEFDSTFLSK
jgi:hypothetical protein